MIAQIGLFRAVLLNVHTMQLLFKTCEGDSFL